MTGAFLHPLLLPLIPPILSLYVWTTVSTLKLAPKPSTMWWMERLASYWIMGIIFFLLYSAGLLILYSLLDAIFNSTHATLFEDELLFFVICALLSALFVSRFWPLFAATFLVEGKRYYKNPIRHYLLWYAGPAWLGPTFFDAWRWTSPEVVARKFTPAVLLAWGLCVLSLIATAVLSGLYPPVRLLFVFLASILFIAPFLVFTTICCWYALFAAGVSPLCVVSEDLPAFNPEMADLQTELLADRAFQYRFPKHDSPIWKFIFPSSIVASGRDTLLREIADASPCRAFHGGEYFEMWSDSSGMQNDLQPDLLLDLQGAVLMICVLNQESRAMSRVFKLLERWGERFPVMGLGL